MFRPLFKSIMELQVEQCVHMEVTHSLETDSFIWDLRRLIARWRNVRQIVSDNEFNFVKPSVRWIMLK